MPEVKEGSILIVNDESKEIDTLNNILKEEYTVYVAKTGAVAIELAQSACPDLILLDVALPDMSGYDALRELKENIETKTIPVIFIAPSSNAIEEERAFLLGAVDYVTHPLVGTIVKARVRNHMRTVSLMRLVAHLDVVDMLTGVANRRFFLDTLVEEGKKAVKSKKALSILFIDVHTFKQYNETYGYLQGDVLLQTFAKLLSRYRKKERDLVARMDGAHFALLLPENGINEANSLAEDIRQAVEVMEISRVGSMTTQVSVNIGVHSGIPAGADEALAILEKAIKLSVTAKEQRID